MLASTLATAGCGNSPSSGGTGGTGGSSSSGGAVGTGGSPSTGGAVGTGGSPSTSGSVTTLGGDKPLTTLTPAEVAQLCTDTYAYFGNAIPTATACKWRGLRTAVSSSSPTDSDLQRACTDPETSCLQGSPGSTDIPSCPDIPSNCTVTVADYSTCIGDEVAAFTQAVSELADCATATLDDMPAVWDVMGATPPASCASLDTTCAGLVPPNPAY